MMPDQVTFAITAGSDTAAEKALALVESLLPDATRQEVGDHLKTLHLREEHLELDVDVPGGGQLRVDLSIQVVPPG